jgi:hypothetical protein
MRRLTRVLLGVSLSLLVVSAVQAQTGVGVRAGFNSSELSITVDGQSVANLGSHSGFHGGVDLSIALGQMISVEAGGIYSQKGATDSEGDLSLTIAMDYIDVPLMFAINVPTNGSVKPRIFAGAVASFEMKCKFSEKVSGEESQITECDEEGFSRENTYFSAVFGGGVGIGIGPGSLLLDLGFQLGMTNISDVEGENAKMNVFQASVGYRFPLGG